MKIVLLLVCSNLFMTAAWYGHLKFKSAPLVMVILASWLIALPEYALQVPANRAGHASGMFSAPQLKVLQEVISICVFLVFSAVYLRELPRWNDWLAFALVAVAVVVMMQPWASSASRQPAAAGSRARSELVVHPSHHALAPQGAAPRATGGAAQSSDAIQELRPHIGEKGA